MKNIEVEVRTFIDNRQFDSIKNILDNSFEFEEEFYETTLYFSGEKDLRMRKNENEAFVILKEGKIHDDFRKELEISIKREDFDKMKELLESLGYEVEIEWRRKRMAYKDKEIKILLDVRKVMGRFLKWKKWQKKERKKKLIESLEKKWKYLA